MVIGQHKWKRERCWIQLLVKWIYNLFVLIIDEIAYVVVRLEHEILDQLLFISQSKSVSHGMEQSEILN